MNTKEKIAVMQHYEDGGKVSVAYGTGKPYIISKATSRGDLAWDWVTTQYEIVKEPKVVWIGEFKCGHFDQTDRRILPSDAAKREEYLDAYKKAGHILVSIDEYVST